MTNNPESTWFGLKQVDPDEKTKRVRDVFSSVASKYDVMNDLMSGGFHRLWKERFVATLRLQEGEALLDVAGGTGDIALRAARKTNGKAKIIVCDINPSMLAEGKAKAIDQGFVGEDAISFVEGDAESLPFEENMFDALTIVFGLRNVTHIDDALKDFARVLKPGGRFLCMEFTSGVNPILKKPYDLYCDVLMPWLGEKIAKDKEAYQYLAESIKQFPNQENLSERMEQAGFSDVSWTNIMGGIAVIHEGKIR